MENQNPAQKFKMLNIIYLALMGNMVVVGIMFYFLKQNPVKPDQSLDATSLQPVFQMLVPVSFLIAVVASRFLFTNLIKMAKKKSILTEKIQAYFSATIIKVALVEMAGILGAVAFFLTGNLFFMAGLAFSVVFLYLERPTLTKITEHLALNVEEKNLLES
ncbi:MAG: hypothetical protein H7Y04_16560 [Verrucomicrobia bacterium]|nr:hypothetical protein [Cytophagales bacterium]